MQEWAKRTDGIIARTINRRISGRITKLILEYNVPISPNAITMLVFAFSMLAVPLYALGHRVLAGIVVQASSILDGVDGELARARGLQSRLGEILDSFVDRITNIAFYIGASLYITLHSWPAGGSLLVPLVLVLAVSGDMLVTFVHSKVKETTGVHPALMGRMPPIASRDVRLFILFLASIADLVLEGLALIAVLSYVYATAKTIEAIVYVRGEGSQAHLQEPSTEPRKRASSTRASKP